MKAGEIIAEAPRRDRAPDHARVRPVPERHAVRSRPRQRRAAVLRQPGAGRRRPGVLVRRHAAWRKRKVYTMREPLLGVITAITPFNHPLNQVIHKVAPAIATNNRVVLKPSEKTPLAAYTLADILYEAGLPPPMLSVVTGDPREIADELLTNRARRSGDFHRRRRGRQVHRCQGGLQAAGARARRQRSDHRDGRRRPRGSSDAGRQRLVQELGTALHGSQADAGPAKGRRTASSNCWSRRRAR